MGFSIGSLIGALAPVVGGLFGPIGAALGGAIGAGFVAPRRPSAPSLPGATVQQARLSLPTGGVLARGLPLGTIGGAAVVATVAQLLAMSREATGRPASSRKIRESARVCGIALTAETFGLTESQVCQIIVATGRRRARGISAADLRRTRSTLRKVHNIQHDLRALAPAARRVAHHHHRRS